MRIFLTGASGFVGGEVAAQLVATGHQVTALVHRSPKILANDGRPVDGVACVRGNVADPRLGLSPGEFSRAVAEHDLIIHCAATTRFDLSDDVYAAINIGGAREAVAFARSGDIPLLHVSTAYVCGKRDGAITEDEPVREGNWANGYESSKAAAERLVVESGVRHAIARPSIVVGDSKTGEVREFGAVYGLFKMVAEGRLKRLPAAAGASLDFVPIDYVAAGIALIANRMDEASGAYHLVSGAAIPLEVAIRLVADFSHLHAPELVDPARFDPASLSARERWIFDSAFKHYSSYTSRSPVFDDTRFRRFSGTSCPPTDASYFRKLIQHSIDAKFVKKAA